VRGVRGKIDLSVYPPPDLAVEVVVTHGPKLAMEVCRELGIPELWIFDVPQGRMTFWQRRRGAARDDYVSRERSLAFPVLKAADLRPWLEDTDAEDSDELPRMQQWAGTVLARRLKRRNRR
jgi:Uma2 family endonuclease